jgi:hypothetical protein
MSNPDPAINLMQKGVAEFVRALKPLLTALGDSEVYREIMLNQGLDPNSNVSLDINSQLQNLDGYVGQTDPEIEAFASALDDILEILGQIHAFAGLAGMEDEQAQNQFMSFVLTMATTSYLRTRAPVAWSICRILQLVEQDIFGYVVPSTITGPIGKKTGWEINRVGEFFADGGKYFEQRYLSGTDEDEVRAASDGIFQPLLIFFNLLPVLPYLHSNDIEVNALYGWELGPGEDPLKAANLLADRALTVEIKVKKTEDADPVSIQLNFMIVPKHHGGNALAITFRGGDVEIETGAGWNLGFKCPGTAFTVFIGNNPGVVGAVNPQISLSAKRTKDGTPAVLGDPNGTRLEFRLQSFDINFSKGGGGIKIGTTVSLNIDTQIAGSFVESLVGAGNLRFDLDLALLADTRHGVAIEGAAGMQIVVPISLTIGTVLVQQMVLGLGPGESGGILLDLGLVFSVKLGPMTLVVEQMGFRFLFDTGAERPVTVGFKPPKGLGVAVDCSVVKGGGYLFFDFEKQQYAGVVQLRFGTMFTLTAVGLLTGKMPDGSKGYSLLVIISAEFPGVGIQLGFGFSLTAIGGLIGVHRTIVPQALRDGIKNRTVDAIMFPKDPVANAPQLIGALSKVFPPVTDRYTLGVMVQIAWSAPLLKMSVGIIVEFPSPVRIVLLGKIRVLAPEEEAPLVVFNLDVIGILDFGTKEFSLDATLYDSRVLVYAITGDMAMRASWGENSIFAVSIGGFNPRFNPPKGFPKLERAAITLGVGDNPRLRSESYFALTSNTFQTGARVELYAAAAGFSVVGYVGWDLLIQFDPLRFWADFSAGVALKRGGTTLMAITLTGTLAGFLPLWVSGTASFTLLFFTVSIGFKFTIIEGDGAVKAAPIDVLGLLVGALSDNRNWAAFLPAGEASLTTMREILAPDELVVHPLATLGVRQTIVPLGLEISRFGQSEPAGERLFDILSVTIGNTNAEISAVNDHFAPAQFFSMSDDEKLTSPSFEQMKAGVKIGTTDIKHGEALAKPVVYETKVVEVESGVTIAVPVYQLSSKKMSILAQTGAVAKGELRRTGDIKYAGPGPIVTYEEQKFAVASKRDLSISAAQPGARSYSMAKQAMSHQLGVDPLADLQVVSFEEAVN